MRLKAALRRLILSLGESEVIQRIRNAEQGTEEQKAWLVLTAYAIGKANAGHRSSSNI